MPGAIIVERWSARKWLARIMITWGLVTILAGFVHIARQFYLGRFWSDVAEASFFPGIIVYLTHWFRHSDRAKAIGFFYIGVPGAPWPDRWLRMAIGSVGGAFRGGGGLY